MPVSNKHTTKTHIGGWLPRWLGSSSRPLSNSAPCTVAALGSGDSRPARSGRLALLAASAATGLLWAALATPALASAPTVNGLFYGDGDHTRYPATPYAVSVGGSKLYLTLVDGVLYVALVVGRSVNDNMFDSGPGGQQPYMSSGGWGSHRTAKRLTDSEFAEFNLIVGPEGSRQTFTWQQGYAGQPSTDKTLATWESNDTVAGGGGTLPPGLLSASSLMWNMNNYATSLAASTNTWTMPGSNTNANQWKSPFDPSAPNDVTEVDGYPATGQLTYSSTYEWEWSMVYEWSVDMTQFGESPVFVVTGASHHSPSKNGPEDDEFPDQDPNNPPPPLMDFGDLPAPYPTLLADDGARHIIDPSGARLGDSLDSETGGQPNALALGDDVAGVDDEDGVELLTPLIPGQEATFRVHVGAPGFLSAFIDWNGNGTLDGVTIQSVDAGNPATVATGTLADTHFSEPGFYEFTVLVPLDAEGMMPARFRITNGAGQGGASGTGEASSGEVEDYIFLSSIGDYVWSDVNQNGIQDLGEPGVQGVTVNLRDADGDVVATTTTDASGFYEFTGLFGDDYRVEFVLPEGYVGFTTKGAGSEPTIDSNANSDGLTDIFTLAPNQVRSDIDAGLVPEGAPPTAVVLGVFELEVMEVTQLLRALGAGDADNAGLLALLQTWDPGAAATLAGAGREQLSMALVDHLDPDGDGRVAVLRWETLEEVGTVGFYVDRRDDRGWTRINNTMLPAMVAAPWGGEYWLADPGAQPGGDYQYRLIEIEARGTIQEYGPFDLRIAGT